jgi:hypothetical protein
MPDRTCLLGVYREEEGGADKFAHAWGGVMRSNDRGKTWQSPIGDWTGSESAAGRGDGFDSAE